MWVECKRMTNRVMTTLNEFYILNFSISKVCIILAISHKSTKKICISSRNDIYNKLNVFFKIFGLDFFQILIH